MDGRAQVSIEPLAARLLAREHVLRLLALAASDPRAARFERARDPEWVELAVAAARHLSADPAARPAELAPGETCSAELDLAPLARALLLPRAELAEAHDAVFGLVVSVECPPYELEYCPQTFSVHRSQRLADVAGFYRAFGVEPGRDAPERADHVATELEFQAWLAAKERYARGQIGPEWEERAAVARDAQRDFLAEHLAWWVPAFARALEGRARALAPRAPLQAELGGALAALIPLERALLGVPPPAELAPPRPGDAAADSACAGCGVLDGAG